MSLSKQEMKFLLDSLKVLVSKVGMENPIRSILRKSKSPLRKPSGSKERELAKKLVFLNGQSTPAGYGGFRSPIGG